MTARTRAAALVLAMTVLTAACQPSIARAPATPEVVQPPGSLPPIVRDVLAGAQPSAAADRNLELVRYTIQPGTRLALHRHPGMQLALVESGVLMYTVVQGEVTVHQVDGGERRIGAGQTGQIVAGEWIAENEGVVHFGENAGPEVVVILASSLLEADEPAAIPVDSPVPS